MSGSRWDSEVYNGEAQLVSSPQNLAWRYALVQSLVTPATVAGDMLFVSWGVGTLTLAGATIPAAYNRVVYPGQVAQLDKGVVDTNPFQALPLDAWSGQFSVDTEPFSDGVVQSQPAIPAPYIVTRSELSEGTSPTYSAAMALNIGAGVNTDVLVLVAGTQVVRVNHIELSGFASAATLVTVYLLVRSAGNTGGTFTPITAVPHEKSDPAATAAAYGYTVKPTAVGAEVGQLRESLLLFIGSAVQPDRLIWDWGALPTRKRPTLGGFFPDMLAINLNSQAVAGELEFNIEWTEDAT